MNLCFSQQYDTFIFELYILISLVFLAVVAELMIL